MVAGGLGDRTELVLEFSGARTFKSMLVLNDGVIVDELSDDLDGVELLLVLIKGICWLELT